MTTNSFIGSSYPFDAVFSSVKQSKSKCKSRLRNSSEKLSPSCISSYVPNFKHSGGGKVVGNTSSVVSKVTYILFINPLTPTSASYTKLSTLHISQLCWFVSFEMQCPKA
jgi:hypothetical protein